MSDIFISRPEKGAEGGSDERPEALEVNGDGLRVRNSR